MTVELIDITKRYAEVTALNHVSLNVEDGEFLTLLGPSGCGKTTLLRIVAGFVQPDEGEVLIRQQRVDHLPPSQRQTGMVFQSYALFPHMTVKKNISFGLRMHGVAKEKRDQKVREVAGLVGIEGLLDRYPQQVSGGQQQRVALARTLAVEPEVLLLDEPMAALDRKLRVEMRTEVRKLIKKLGRTTIFVTHDQEEALTMSDRIAVMERGVIVQVGTPMQIYDRPRTPFVASFIGNSNLFRGVVRMDDQQRPVFEGDGARIPLPAEFENRIDQRVNLLLRPEHIQIASMESEELKDELAFPGTVAFATHLGVSIEYEVELESGKVLKLEVNRTRGQSPYNEGTRVWVKPVDSSSYLTIPDRKR